MIISSKRTLDPRFCLRTIIFFLFFLRPLALSFLLSRAIRMAGSLKSYGKNTVATSEAVMPGERTVLKGLIGHSNSSGDQAPWECDGENPVSCAELSTVPTVSIYNAFIDERLHSPCDSEVRSDLAHRRSLHLADSEVSSYVHPRASAHANALP